MKKNTLRSLGLGFLSAAILTSGFAIFVQGQSPIPGIKVNALFNADNANISSYESHISSLESERDALNESLTSTNTGDTAQLQSSLESFSRDNASLRAQLGQPNESNTDESADSPETSESSGELAQGAPAVEGTFAISDGEASSDIANRLVSEGYIASAEEFQSLLDEWDLNSVIQAGDYQINSDMSIHDIASIITNGAYYYY